MSAPVEQHRGEVAGAAPATRPPRFKVASDVPPWITQREGKHWWRAK